jgi:NADH-quinone oxidoreductase subunit C
MKPTLETLSAQFARLIGPTATAPISVPSVSPTPVAAPPPAPVAPAPVVAAQPLPSAPASGVGTPPAPTAKPAVAAPPVAPPAPAVPPPPIQTPSHAAKGYDLDVRVGPADVAAAATILDHEGFGLDAITGVDWLAQNEMEVVYDYFHPLESLRVVVRTRVPRAMPTLPTISPVFPGANWHERETHDFFGIEFSGHPNLKPFLLPEDAQFHPLRKDYQP